MFRMPLNFTISFLRSSVSSGPTYVNTILHYSSEGLLSWLFLELFFDEREAAEPFRGDDLALLLSGWRGLWPLDLWDVPECRDSTLLLEFFFLVVFAGSFLEVPGGVFFSSFGSSTSTTSPIIFLRSLSVIFDSLVAVALGLTGEFKFPSDF